MVKASTMVDVEVSAPASSTDSAVTFSNSDVLIVIPARGGSKGIPRKNVRLLDGRPLISYVIQASLEVGGTVVVSTDDTEIAQVSQLYGARVLMRPSDLADDTVPLDPVIVHAWRTAEAEYSTKFNWVATVQPTSPLVSAETIRRVLEKARLDALDCCITVSDARHLYWCERDGVPQPVYSERVNRQWLPPFWKETGAVIVSSRRQMETGQRVGGRIGLFPMPDWEALDIDSYDDWVVAEYRLRTPRVAFRVVGNERLGLGHVYRALTIASRMFNPSIDFFVDEGSDVARRLISERNYRVFTVKGDDEFVERVIQGGYTLVINDILDTDAGYIRALRSNDGRVVVNFEDLGPGAAEANLVINALYEYSTPLPNQRFGWQYACLRDEFLQAPMPRGVQDPPKTLLITFGGTDPADLSSRTLKAAARALEGCNASVIVVLGIGNPRADAVRKLAESLRQCFATLEVYTHVTRMSELMARADLAVTSNGRTIFELASLGVPMIAVSQNSREATHTFGRISGGVLDLGLESGVSEDRLASAISRVWKDHDLRTSMHARLLQFDLKRGVDRVIQCINGVYDEWRERARRFRTSL